MMVARLFILFLLAAFSLTGCATTSLDWYKEYGIASDVELSQVETIPKLIQALDDERPEVRGYAAERLGFFGPAAIDAKIKLYILRTSDPNGSVKLFAHYALKEIIGDAYTDDYLFFEDQETPPAKQEEVKYAKKTGRQTGTIKKQEKETYATKIIEPPKAKTVTPQKPTYIKPTQLDIVPADYFALIIGNNNYRYLPKLKTAANDAREVASSLERLYGFNTKLLIDATRRDIVDALNLYREQMTADDSLLIYYAGHGIYDNVAESAYWLPVDAREDTDTEWVIVDTITTNLKRIQAKHVLIVADSCYAGTLTRAMVAKLDTKDERSKYLEKIHGKKSRTLLASGGNEPVADSGGGNHSVFANAFLKGLREMEHTVFTAEELYLSTIKEQVAGKSEQMPEYNTIRNSGHDGGDFCFIRK